MKSLLKIFIWTIIAVILASVILFSASLIMQDKVAELVVKSLSNSISTKLEFGDLKLSFLRKFPNASVELKDVVVHSSKTFNKSQFTEMNTDTLLASKLVTVEFSIRDIINGVYNIQRISANDGRINLCSDSTGMVNYEISVKSKQPAGNEEYAIDLDRITLTDMRIAYTNLATRVFVKSLVETGKFKSRITDKFIDFTAGAEMQIESLSVYDAKLSKGVAASIDLKLHSSSEGVSFEKGILKIEDYSFGISGSVSDDNTLDLILTGNDVDISKFKKYIPEKYTNTLAEYNPSGVVTVNSIIKGKLSRLSNPHIEIDYSLKNGKVELGGSDLKITGLSLNGNFSNGKKNDPTSSSININDFRASIGSASFSGTFSLNDFRNPITILTLKGNIVPYELKEFFKIKELSTAAGSADIDIKINSLYNYKGKPSKEEILSIKPQGKVSFNSLALGIQDDKYLFNNVKGDLILSDLITANNVQLNYRGQNIRIDGEFNNLQEWLTGKNVVMAARADITLTRLYPELLEKEFSDDTSSIKRAFVMPDDLDLDITFKIDSFRYKSFSSSAIKGALTYKPGLLTFRSLNMKSLNGTITGSGFITQNNTLSVIAKGIFNVGNIDVNNAFTSFRNFGQEFIKAENIDGDLSGSFSVLIPMDSMLNPSIKSIVAEGKYTLLNGALINFEPVKELSDFIELSELEEIHFEKLENDFFIRNNFLYTPQMDVKSSAADLSINGKHSFDNDYEYHVKMLLSEILSKKRKKQKGSSSEFGVVQDDGLGRTSILLKIVGKGENVKVSYDLKAAGSEVKKNIKTERQTLKTILNQEYGWYKNDTATKSKTPVKKTTRFRISFDETDSTKNNTPTPVPEKKESPVKNLFKKKINP